MINPDAKHRHSIRLREYDYAQKGAYFVTLCTHRRLVLFGRIVNGEMDLNDAGIVAQKEWQTTVEMRPDVKMDVFVVMPNHVHGIVMIETAARAFLADIVRGYKSAVTGKIRALFNAPELAVWQRNYYEHIIRDDASYLKIAEYIQNNPKKWTEDTYYAE